MTAPAARCSPTAPPARCWQQPTAYRFAKGTIAATVGRQNAALQKLIAGATGRIDKADAARCGVMRLPLPSGKPDFAVVVSSLANGSALSEDGPVALILVTDPKRSPHSRAR
ncbi:MAG TPA: hypothetical protein VNZ53_23690 [Steroidobacteraceae bacterium]|nr:hypothetical protein [Steroidobacteraceae bacterium]